MRTKIWSAKAEHRASGRAQANAGGPDALLADNDERWPSHSEASALSQFVGRSRPWSRERVSLPRRVRRLLWLLIVAQLTWAIGLTTITMTGPASCAGRVCTIATLDGRVALLLVCSLLSLVGLVGVAVVTRGLASTDSRETAGLTVSVLAGGVALLGVAALLSVIAIVLLALAVLFGTMTVTP